MAFSTKSGSGARAEINVTPMIDILMVLLIIFMVISPSKQVGLPALVPQPPDAASKPPDPSQFIVLTVDAKRDVYLNTELVPLVNLEKRLLAAFGGASHGTLCVKGDKGLDFQIIAQVMDIARGAGVQKIALTSDEIAK